MTEPSLILGTTGKYLARKTFALMIPGLATHNRAISVSRVAARTAVPTIGGPGGAPHVTVGGRSLPRDLGR